MEVLKPTVLFVDNVCPRPYDPSNIELPGIGGTEHTVVQVAENLSPLFNVVVEQHNRFEGEDYNGKALYTNSGKTVRPNFVVFLRDPRRMGEYRGRYPDSKFYLWSHDLADSNFRVQFSSGVLQDNRCVANVCVSQWHRTQTIDAISSLGYTGQFKCRVIYNPLSEEAIYKKAVVDPNKLFWGASPHKGLNRAYELFFYLMKLNPHFKLYISNPGYLEGGVPEELKKSVVSLGTLPHTEVLEHLRTSLCLFYPNTVFPETFGKIMAESNAVGTPVLTHPFGASREVLDTHPEQFLDCRNTETVLKRVMKWYEGDRPYVRGNSKFKIQSVIREWERLFNDTP